MPSPARPPHVADSSAPSVPGGRAPFERALAIVEVLTVGLPFCAFKAITGLDLVRSGVVAGWLLIGLGAIDAALNVVNGVSIATRGARSAPICVLDALFARRGAFFGRLRELGLAADTMLAFTLVAAMIAWSRLGDLPAIARGAWSVAVVLNVLGAGGIRLARAVEVFPRRAA